MKTNKWQKRMKRAIRTTVSLLLAVVMLFGMGHPAFADSRQPIESGLCGDNVSWSYFEGGELVISGQGEIWDACPPLPPIGDIEPPSLPDDDEEQNWPEGGSGTDLPSEDLDPDPDCPNISADDSSADLPNIVEGTALRASNVEAEGIGTELGADISWGERASSTVKWQKYRNQIQTVKVGEGVTRVGREVFAGHEIREAALSQGLKEIGESAFENCVRLESIRIPSGVTKIEDFVFLGCKMLKCAWIPASVEEIGLDVFKECNSAFAIYGELGSAAERYAAEHHIPFYEETPVKPAKKDPILLFSKEYSQGIEKTYGEAPFSCILDTKETDGAVTYESSAPKVAEINQTGRITIKMPGKTRITAKAAEGEKYAAGKASFWLVVQKAENKITARNSITITTSASPQKIFLGAEAKGKAKLTYRSDSPSVKVAGTSGEIKVAAKFVGSASITVSAKETAYYKKASKKIKVTVKPAKSVRNAVLAAKSGSVVIGGTKKIQLKNVPGGSKITYKIDKRAIASVSSKGKVTGKKAGTAQVKVTVRKGKDKKNLTFRLTVAKPRFTKASLTIGTKESKKLSVQNKPGSSVHAKYAWSSENTKVAKVKDGKVTGISKGTTNVRLKLRIAKNISYSLKCKIKVKASENEGSMDPGREKISLDGWKEATNNGSHSKMSKKNGMLVIDNQTITRGIYTKDVTVKPNTDYRIRALVRVEGYKGQEKPGGVTVGYGKASEASCYETDFVRSKNWEQSEVWFRSGNNEKITLHVANGGYGAASKGKAYIKDIVLEELPTDNKWNVLVLIYRNVKTVNYQKSFSDADIKELKEVLGKFPDTIQGLSGGRMQIGKLDIQVVDAPVKTVSGQKWGDLTTGPGNDINFDAYLEGKDYNQIAVFAPLAGAPTTNGWFGLGGGYYRYSGKNIYYCIINDTMHYGSPNAEVGGKRYDARTAVLIHEMLHCVETNSVLRGWSGFQPLHDSEKNGYVYSKELEWIDWYADLMQDRIKNGQGKGFRPESFYVPHRPK